MSFQTTKEDILKNAADPLGHSIFVCTMEVNGIWNYSGKKNIWSPADFVRLPTDKEMISL